MERLFLIILNMSFSGGIAILAVILLRQFLKKMPRKFSYFLWVIVLIRLLCPVLPTAEFGLGVNIKFIEEDVRQQPLLADNITQKESVKEISEIYGKTPITEASNEYATQAVEVEKNLTIAEGSIWPMAAYIWLAGVLLLNIYTAVSYLWLKHRFKEICQKGDTIVISEKVRTPFSLGFFQPVIFLPVGLSKEQQSLIIAHERAHIRRKDQLIKAIYFLALSVHWFNPLVWTAFYLMEQDMEMSCDEAVLHRTGADQKKLYARTLLLFAQGGRQISGCPIAFGENSTKARIKNTVKVKSAAPWTVAAGCVAIVLAAGLLLVNRSREVKEGTVVGAAELQNVSQETMPEEKEDSAQSLQEQAESQGLLKQEEAERQQEEVGEKEEAEEAKLVEYKQSGQTDAYGNILRNVEGVHIEVGIFYQNPVPGAEISGTYGSRVHPVTGEERFHSGMDFAAEAGTEVLAAADGMVYETGFDKAAGNYVILFHKNGEMTYYANCDTILVETGKEVKVGEQIATVGNTGSATGAHLHFALSYQGSFIEPVITERVLE